MEGTRACAWCRNRSRATDQRFHKGIEVKEVDGVHVVHVSQVFGSQHGGGGSSTALIKALLAHGAEVTLLAERFEGADRELMSPQVQRISLPHLFRARFWNLFARLVDIARVWRAALAAKQTAVIVQGDLPRLNYILLQLLVPLIFIRQDSILTCPANHRFLPGSRTVCLKPPGFSCLEVHARENCLAGMTRAHRIGRILLRLRDALLLRFMRHFVVNSQATLLRHGRKGMVLHPPNVGTEGTLDTGHRDLRQIAFCGSLTPERGADDAIRMLALLPEEYHLEIAGEGAQREELERLAASLEVATRVCFHGWLPSAGRDALLAASGVLVMPSLCHESFGMAGIEAFARGTPVVAYDAGGIAEWCTAKAGVLVQCGDVTAAATAILELTGDPARWQDYSDAARVVADVRFPRGRFSQEVASLVRGATGFSLK